MHMNVTFLICFNFHHSTFFKHVENWTILYVKSYISQVVNNNNTEDNNNKQKVTS